jgi:hypothetical protein
MYQDKQHKILKNALKSVKLFPTMKKEGDMMMLHEKRPEFTPTFTVPVKDVPFMSDAKAGEEHTFVVKGKVVARHSTARGDHQHDDLTIEVHSIGCGGMADHNETKEMSKGQD